MYPETPPRIQVQRGAKHRFPCFAVLHGLVMAIRNPRDWENPSVYSRNKCRSHVPLRAHPSPDSALRYFLKGPDAADNANVLSLNSKNWSFNLYDRPEDVPEDFSRPDFDDGKWGKVMSAACVFLKPQACGVFTQHSLGSTSCA